MLQIKENEAYVELYPVNIIHDKRIIKGSTYKPQTL